MSAQSPHRTRKNQVHPGSTGQANVVVQSLPPREMSPSPSIRATTRSMKTQSMPLVPAVMQLYSQQQQQPVQGQQGSQQQQASPTQQQQSKRSPPPPSSQVPLVKPGPGAGSNLRGDIINSNTPPPPPLPPPPTHSLSQPNVHSQNSPQSQQQQQQSQQPQQQQQQQQQNNPQVPPAPPQHAHSQPNIHAHPRPINRVPPPQFLSSFQSMEDNWQMTEQLMAEFEQAHGGIGLSGLGLVGVGVGGGGDGTSGVAYAGGAGSSGISRVQQQGARAGSGSPTPKELERVRAAGAGGGAGLGGSPKDVERRQGRGESPKTRDRSASQPQPQQAQPQSQEHDPRGSPQYHTPLGTPQEHPSSSSSTAASSYTQYSSTTTRRGDSYSTMPRLDTPPALRKFSPEVMSTMRTTTPAAMKARTPERDRSLPVQEEPEDDHGERWVNADAMGVHDGRDSRAGHRDDDDDETLIEQDSEDQNPNQRGRTEEEEGYTPRSPTANLPGDAHAHDLHSVLYGAPPQMALTARQQTGLTGLPMPKHHRTGSTDQLGLRGIDVDLFVDDNLKGKDDRHGRGHGHGRGRDDDVEEEEEEEEEEEDENVREEELEEQRHYVQEPAHPHHLHLGHHHQQQQQHQPPASQYSNNTQSSEQYTTYSRLHPPQIPHPEDLQSFFDDPASAFIQAYLNSPRPMAPIPPTPHSATAAPSPSPLISSVQPSPAPPVGSPYPYPFTHVRRSHAYAASPIAASSSYDPNHPSVIQEQLALQMQMYARNNHAPVSESNFSPASTPYPGSGYNPWTFLQASRAFGGRRGDPPHSMQSSPSHEPLALPMPNIRGRGLKKRERSANLRNQETIRQKAIQPPPRVESTQPRETTPELSSSGEETSTAGGERYEVPEEGNWVNGLVEDDGGDWVDEDDQEEDDLLDLEYHPSYVSNVEKRRRRWETRWEALIQAFQALDRQTDATLVLLAAPSHSTKLHSLTSRSIRRDPTLVNSPALSSLRTSFRHIASRRRVSRANKISLAERLLSNSGSSTGGGSDGSSESREEDLRRALQAALGSLGALGGLYEQREARWREEMRRISDDRETVELLLKQALNINPPNTATVNQTNGHHHMGHAL